MFKNVCFVLLTIKKYDDEIFNNRILIIQHFFKINDFQKIEFDVLIYQHRYQHFEFSSYVFKFRR